MKNKMIPVLFTLTVFLPQLAYAATPAPAPEKGWSRVGWAIGCVGRMPSNMIICLVALGLLVALAATWCIYKKRNK